MNGKKTVLYLGNFSFPTGNAAGKRVYANGKILRELGYSVIFIGMDKAVNGSVPIMNTQKKYDGFTYYNFPYPQGNFGWVKYRKTFKSLVEFLSYGEMLNSVGLIIYYGSPSLSLFTTKLINYCKANKIKVVADCVDWLTVKTNSIVFDMIKRADNTYQKAYANKRADGVIAISSYLANYYRKHGCLTVTIPPLSPKEYAGAEQESIENNKKILTYAGLPFRIGQQINNCSTLKDRIDKTIILLHQAHQNGSEFVFNIYGFTKEEYLKVIPGQKCYVDALGNRVVFHGHKPNEEIIECIIESDFTILIRDVNRDTTAGFPTKVSESVSCGTPVITTRTSDLECYIEDGKNGFFLDMSDTRKAVYEFQNILEMDCNKLNSMKKYCATTNPFYYKRFISKFNTFVDHIHNEKTENN